jgi:hypothetical protein
MKDCGGRLDVNRTEASIKNFLLSETLDGRMVHSAETVNGDAAFVSIYTCGREGHDLLV